ncbi:hypothetical protein VB715_09840 [Crocosphaera sp. UHCC 0190]|uniref:hypothetical protein n=1 Tax=unclassified Crocosphaera TaxID=2623705 RepID=UPI002B1FF615|nr:MULTISPECIES: hypothetical protein [unclassified Crocosphaera]MEA5510064.1 hypothetical protein [Crocosphaera sp. UHCC 0190]MEA5536991.1 hypothetical protein [Crocosphaera sp. XPORK-15E]
MTSLTVSPDRPADEEREVWESLQQAIADCSGFQQWQARQKTPPEILSLDQQVRLYLRETLETLAY